MINDVRLYGSAGLSTGHKLQLVKINFSIERRQKSKTFVKINWNKLNDMKIRQNTKRNWLMI